MTNKVNIEEYNKIVEENKNLKCKIDELEERLKTYTNNHRHKKYYEKNKETMKEKAKEYMKKMKEEHTEKMHIKIRKQRNYNKNKLIKMLIIMMSNTFIIKYIQFKIKSSINTCLFFQRYIFNTFLISPS